MAKKTKKAVRPKLEVRYEAIENLIPDEDNPNEMDEATFDQLVEEIQEQGFDEPVLVRRHPKLKGKFQIGSGHHRVKAAKVIGFLELPVIQKAWTDRQQKAALAKRNVLRGNLNKSKLRELYDGMVAGGNDPIQVQRELGFVDEKAFQRVYGEAMKSLPPKQQKKLAKAKESIKSMDDLSSVLNRIFKDSGSTLDHGYLVFSFGGKNHHYFQTDKATDKKLQAIVEACEDQEISASEFLQSIVRDAQLPDGQKSVKVGKTKIRKRKKLSKK